MYDCVLPRCRLRFTFFLLLGIVVRVSSCVVKRLLCILTTQKVWRTRIDDTPFNYRYKSVITSEITAALKNIRERASSSDTGAAHENDARQTERKEIKRMSGVWFLEGWNRIVLRYSCSVFIYCRTWPWASELSPLDNPRKMKFPSVCAKAWWPLSVGLISLVFYLLGLAFCCCNNRRSRNYLPLPGRNKWVNGQRTSLHWFLGQEDLK